MTSNRYTTSVDDSIYYSTRNRVIFLQPDLSGYDYVGMEFIPYITKYDGTNGTSNPDIDIEFRSLIAHKLVELASPLSLRAVTKNLYKDELNTARSHRHSMSRQNRISTFDPFASE